MLFFVNESTIRDDSAAPTFYVVLVVINFIVNIIRALMDLFGICGNK